VLILAAVLIGAIAAAHIVPFPFLLEAFRPAGSVWRIKPTAASPRTIYFTFDDGPNPYWTPPLLDALKETGVRATFFLIDDYVTDATAPIVKRIADEGHVIGLHSGTRRLMILSPEAMVRHLERAASRIEAVTGREPCRLFRPHAGWRSATMYTALSRANFRLAGWSWGMWDWDWWRAPRADRIEKRLLGKASPGDIIVIHDGHHKNPERDRRHAGETVRRLAPALSARGYSFGTLCESSSPGRSSSIR
jgi:peptidoglycan/xylan/chitin deacetylase (PgdA/CDA1 family)